MLKILAACGFYSTFHLTVLKSRVIDFTLFIGSRADFLFKEMPLELSSILLCIFFYALLILGKQISTKTGYCERITTSIWLLLKRSVTVSLTNDPSINNEDLRNVVNTLSLSYSASPNSYVDSELSLNWMAPQPGSTDTLKRRLLNKLKNSHKHRRINSNRILRQISYYLALPPPRLFV